MLRFWISFMREHKDLLQKEQLRPQEPHNLYPLVWTVGRQQAAAAIYTENKVVSLPGEVNEYIILNGTKGKRIILESGISGTYKIIIKDCMGEVTDRIDCQGAINLLSVDVPVAGQIYITRTAY